MSDPAKPLVYLFLGTAGSGRRALARDLAASGLAEGDRAAVLLPAAEPEVEFDAKLPGVARWVWTEHGTISAELPAGATHVLFISDGRLNPVDQVEALKPWIEAHGAEIGRVICVVDCGLASANSGLLPWYDACVHFSDVVLLNRREDVENKWISDFQSRYTDQFFPCLFELVKKDRVKNAIIVLDPVARRISQYFEDEPQWAFESDDEEDAADEEEVEITAAEDPYLERRAGGRRVKEIPDITAFLPSG
ncbi:MAG: hypothetical protein RIS54_109 [Verrucomicrobiota bacterium]